MAEATPRPWACTVSGEEVELHDCGLGAAFGLYVYNLTEGVKLTEQDARLIVKAVNAHDALVEALEKLRAQALQSPDLLRTEWGQEALNYAAAALASIGRG